MEDGIMTSTALRASAQGANNTHMVFKSNQRIALHQGWQTSGSVRVVRLAFNLYTNGTPTVDDYKKRDDQIEASVKFY